MQEIIYTKSYESLKTEIREELSKSVNSFIRIGYLLKVARDTAILATSPYRNMEEFAYGEFKIDKGTASKFININDRFSQEGYSDRIKTEYEGIGWSKLSIMLQLPDAVNEELSDSFSKQEIQAIREEIAEAEKETPLQHMFDGETQITAVADDNLQKAIRQLGESEPELYVSICEAQSDKEKIKLIMAPSGEKIYSIRIRGVGRLMLSLKDYEENVTLINERSGEKEIYTWNDIISAWEMIIDTEKTAKESWETVFEQEYPAKDKVAPVQPAKPQENKVKKVNDNKNSTIDNKNTEQISLHDVNKEIPIPEPVEEPEEETEEIEEKPEKTECEEQLPGQINVVDVLPKPVIDRKTYEARRKSYIESFDNNIGCAMLNKDSANWELVKTDLKDAMNFIDKLIEIESMEVEDEEL